MSVLSPTSLFAAYQLTHQSNRRYEHNSIAMETKEEQEIPDFAKVQKDLCPCCQLPLQVGHQRVDNTPTKVMSRRQSASVIRDSSVSILSDDFDTCDDDDDDNDMDETDRTMLPGLLGQGVAYTVREIIAQGYLHKKGSGYDWLGSRYWKARWAVLVVSEAFSKKLPAILPEVLGISHSALFFSIQWAKVEESPVDVPLLQIFWSNTSPAASTVISLDSAVVIPDNSCPNSSNPFRFMIRHIKRSISDSDSALQITRFFSCPQASRDDWVFAINHALLEYEKAKASALRLKGLSLTSSSSQPNVSFRASSSLTQT